MTEHGITVYGTQWCPDCKRTKQFLGEQRIHYRFVDIDADTSGRARVEQVNEGKHVIPVVQFPDGSHLVEPTNAELADKLGLRTKATGSFYDLVVVGSGPAGLTAALYTAREGIDTLVVERSGVGGQVGLTDRLDNFPGFPEGVAGAEFAERLQQQARRFGVEVLSAQEVVSLSTDGTYRVVRSADGSEYSAYAVLLALGSTYRRLGIPGEEDFIGSGVHFCATCDGPFYRGEPVIVIGGGNSAGEEALFLTRYARDVTIVTRDRHLTASPVVADKVAEHPNIDVIVDTTPVSFVGDHGRLSSVVVRDNATGSERRLEVPAAFVFVGLTPNTGVVAGVVARDPGGFVLTAAGLMTDVAGVFAAGDCRAGSTKQAASAAGEGAAAAIAIARYLEPLAGGMPHTRAVPSEAVVV